MGATAAFIRYTRAVKQDQIMKQPIVLKKPLQEAADKLRADAPFSLVGLFSQTSGNEKSNIDDEDDADGNSSKIEKDPADDVTPIGDPAADSAVREAEIGKK
jgi:hypothetical protein